jgi:4-diphosphocytidyl-2-C-methyl-D-erythritol kinase
MLKIRAYAKLNLSLAITGMRPDGYHELDTIMQSISLSDTIYIEKSDTLTIQMDSDVADTVNNTAYKAARFFFGQTGTEGAAIMIQKRIPVMSGLGGASADAAAVLYGLDRLYGTNLSPVALRMLAKKVGADVPFAITGGTARAKGIGDILSSLELKKPLYFTVVKPRQGVSTADAYQRYRGSGHISIDTVEYALLKGDLPLFYRHAGNALGIPALSSAPDIIKASDALRDAGAPEALMTGSGSAMFAVFESEGEAMRVLNNINGDFELCGVYSSVNSGIEAEDEPV